MIQIVPVMYHSCKYFDGLRLVSLTQLEEVPLGI